MSEKSPSKHGEGFGRWFDWVIDAAEVYDYGRYPIKGMGIWRPYGFKIRELVLARLRELLNSTGHEEVLFPLLVTEDLLAKEAEHVKGFEDEVYWVTHGGLEELDVKLALRPTSEVAITYMEKLWYQSYRQLPKKLYQVVSIFRYETKATRPMIRLREVTTFKEAHTLHESFEDADRQVSEAVDVYSRFFDDLGIPYIVSKRPEWDKFPGALYTVAFDTLMPDGRALQIGTVHHLGQTFTRAFEVKIYRKDESVDFGWQTSYGVSDRVIASLIAIHGDDRGLVLPPRYAPIQVIVVPIPSSDEDETERVWRYAENVYERVSRESGFRVEIDLDREKRPAEKFYDYEIKGVPVRLEVGPREFREGSVTVFRRDLFKRSTVKLEDLVSTLQDVLADIDKRLKESAWRGFRSRIYRVSTLDEAKRHIEEKAGIVEVPWCGSDSCAFRMSDASGGKTLGTPLEVTDLEGLKCPICGRDAVTFMRLARTY